MQVAASLEIIAAALSDGGSTWVHLWPDGTLPFGDDPSLSVLVVSVALTVDQLGTSPLGRLLHYFVGNTEAEVRTGVGRNRSTRDGSSDRRDGSSDSGSGSGSGS